MIDIHSHILYGIDDGAEAIGDSVKMAVIYEVLGFKKVYCSPHVMNFYYENDLNKVVQRCAELQEVLNKEKIELELIPFAEVYLDESVPAKVAQKKLPVINGKLLVEGPLNEWPPYLEEILFAIKIYNVCPIIAHIERNRDLQKNLAKIRQLKEGGCLIQGNILSITGYYGASAKRCFEELLKADLYDFLATDMHNAENNVAMYREAMDKAKKLVGEQVKALFKEV